MIATLNTKQVRAIANTYKGERWRATTYTDKTSKLDTARRSVVYAFWHKDAADALADFLVGSGMQNTITRTSSDCNAQRHVLGGEYVRIMADIG